MLAAQIQKSADQAVAAVSVVITAARPVVVVGKVLEHQVEQLHRLRDLGFRHRFERFPSVHKKNAPYHAPPQSAVRPAHGKLIGSTKPGSLFFTLPTLALTGPQIMSSEG